MRAAAFLQGALSGLTLGLIIATVVVRMAFSPEQEYRPEIKPLLSDYDVPIISRKYNRKELSEYSPVSVGLYVETTEGELLVSSGTEKNAWSHVGWALGYEPEDFREKEKTK